MKVPEWTKPAIWGAVAGAVALSIIGFGWGGWMLAGTAEKVAKEQSQAAVVAALTPICIKQSEEDPQRNVQLAALEAESNWQRRDKLMDIGWATMPGSDQPNRAVAAACLEQLAELFNK